jgi:hypothetical protein
MLTISETPIFVADAQKLWTEEERGEFFFWLAQNPEAGAVVRGSGGCRKVRWSRAGGGKSGGVRAIYFTRLTEGELCMLVLYAKSDEATIPGHLLKQIRDEVERGNKNKS